MRRGQPEPDRWPASIRSGQTSTSATQGGRTPCPHSSPERSATSRSSVIAGRGRRPSSRRCSSRPARSSRLGTIEAGTTVTDWDEDEHKRQMSISLSLAHTTWQGRKINLVDCPGDPSFQGEARCAVRVVEGAVVARQRRDGRRGRHGPHLAPRRRARPLARRHGQHARPRARRLLPRARAAAGAALAQVHRRPHPDRRRARAHRHRRRPPHVRLPEPRTAPRRATRSPIPDDMRRARAGVPREAPRRGRADRRGADGALPRGRGARRARRRRGAQARGHPGRGVPGRVRCRQGQPRHPRAARPPRRGRAVAREEGPADGLGRRRPLLRSSSRRWPTRSPGASTSSASSRGRSRPSRPCSTCASARRSGWARCCSSRARRPHRRRSSARATSAPSRS